MSSGFATLTALEHSGEFIERHIGPSESEQQHMLTTLGCNSLNELIQQTVPTDIQATSPTNLGSPTTEQGALQQLEQTLKQNKQIKSMIGMGYTPCITPTVILRNVLENPGWYTAYTPYQPEISQGRLEGLLTFQQMIIDLTGMELANASLLDEATAAAEAMTFSKRLSKAKNAPFFLVDQHIHPQTLSVLQTRAEPLGIQLKIGDLTTLLDTSAYFGVIAQYPNTLGDITDLTPWIEKAHAQQALFCVAADILSLAMLKPPGECGADIVLGSTQRFGVPMGYGGPSAAYFATREVYKRSIPGRIIGVSLDSQGKPALRMAMQTREQHIRREKAMSNICTAQALLANMAAFYAIYHGPEGIKRIAQRVNRLTSILAKGLIDHGVKLHNTSWFDTLTLEAGAQRDAMCQRALDLGINLRCIGTTQLGITCDETTTQQDIATLWQALLGDEISINIDTLDKQLIQAHSDSFPTDLRRQSALLTHAVFNTHHSETEMLRYLKQLENKDISLTHSMIPLGSCTMKLNATSEMLPLSWTATSQLHPFAPLDQAQGYQLMISELEQMLCAITGFDAVCMQPNSGAQGEYAGLLTIRRYLKSKGEGHRRVCLIPTSAHGTNPASAAMADMQIVLVECDIHGNVDVNDLRTKALKHASDLAALMITYPSTHGVFEEEIKNICEIIHQVGGQVYMDGANLNALVCVSKPAEIGADVSHMNLHKTFCIPHGGGGPGMGPIGVKSHLIPHLPSHPVVAVNTHNPDNTAVAATPYGSSSILTISWMYIKMMGFQGLRRATEVAILNANYMANQLSMDYPILFTGRNQRVAHECIIDLRPLKDKTGITEEDIAKRLMDFGFHAPTMSFPVAGTLMIEPTESESLTELDKFIQAMRIIRTEISHIEEGKISLENSPLRLAPHTQTDMIEANWQRQYSREQGCFPAEWVLAAKVWPSVNRIDNVYGDRNLFCACIPTENYR